jgi:hypothetical protein
VILSLADFVVWGFVLARSFWPLPPVPLVVSGPTTYFTEPLNADGTVNYVAAYNQHVGGAVAPAENMAVPIIEALGPRALSADLRPSAIAALKLNFSDDDPHFVRLEDHLRAHAAEYEALIPPAEEQAPETEQDRHLRQLIRQALGDAYREPTPLRELADAQIEQATTQPWRSEELRIVTDWLTANEPVLDRIVGLKRHEAFFLPMISLASPPEVELRSLLADGVLPELRQVLVCRATLRLGQGDLAGAWDDALLMCYLGRLLADVKSGGQVYGALLLRRDGVAIITRIAHGQDLTSARAMEMLHAYDALPPAGYVGEADVLLMRLMSLDFMMRLARDRAMLQSLDVALPASQWGFSVDANDVMTRINAVYDDVHEAVVCPDFPSRSRMVRNVAASSERLLSELEQRITRKGALAQVALLLSSSRAKRQYLDDVIVYTLLAFMLSDANVALTDVRLAVMEESARLALALAAYRADHEDYPDTLAALAPRYLAAVPQDHFTGGDLHYERHGGGYCVWSVGEDGEDDGADDDDIVLTLDE